MTTTMRATLSLVLAAAAGCAPVDDDAPPAAVSFATPQALVDCAAAPALEARMFVSGTADPCKLTVDVDAGTTSGSCDVTAGVVRRMTIDWTVDVQHGGPFVLIVAQAQKDLDLTAPDEADATLTLKDGDVKIAGCKDMQADPNRFEGKDTISVDGTDVPVCDVDNSCAGGGACSNLEELCAGTDPFVP